MKYPKKGKTKRHLSKKGKPDSKAWLHSPHHQPHGQWCLNILNLTHYSIFYLTFPSNESPPFSHSHYLPSSQCSVSADLTAIFLAQVKFKWTMRTRRLNLKNQLNRLCCKDRFYQSNSLNISKSILSYFSESLPQN